MALIDNYNASADSTWRQKVTAAAISAAESISSEATNTPDHANRAVLAKAVMNSPDTYGAIFALAVAVNLAVTDPTVPTDAQINTSVASVWNAVAGVP